MSSTAAYLRVSTGTQTTDQQRDVIAGAGLVPERVLADTASGRAGAERPGWEECLGWLREGDTLVVVAVDRLGRSVREVAATMHELTERGIALKSLREGVTPLLRPAGRSCPLWQPSRSWSWSWARNVAKQVGKPG
jgi:DNA invertase Pin-like site-specific DNA recombinase